MRVSGGGPAAWCRIRRRSRDWGGEALRYRKVLARSERRLAREERAVEMGRPVRRRAVGEGGLKGGSAGGAGRKRRSEEEADGMVNGRGTKRARHSEALPVAPSDEESDSDDLGDLTEDEMPDEVSLIA